MHSRALRLGLFLLSVAGIVAAAAFIRSTETTLTARRAALRAFDGRAREATDALADLRTAQQAYVAFGQGLAFWLPKVDSTTQTITGALATLQQSATSLASRSALDEAVATMSEFGNVDARIRGYLKSGAQLMAADIVFTEGGEAAAGAARLIERARLEEHQESDRVDAAANRQMMIAAASAAGLLVLVLAVFALAPSRPAQADTASSGPIANAAARDAVAAADELLLRRDDLVEPSRLTTAAALKSTAQICTDIGRVGDTEELKGLLSRAAEVLDASGLVLWLGTAAGAELRPVVAHGYSPQMVARIPPVPRAANNAAAAAFRSGTLQIVLSRPGSTVKGAIVAPVLSYDGCIGVLSAEVRDGGEASDTVQALAAIFASQLAGIVAATPAAADQPASTNVEPRTAGTSTV